MVFSIDRFALDNGLRVVVIPDRTAPMTAVAVHYGVGFRTEPEGRSGFAHLFEHVMFRGSENVPDGQFRRLLAANGGSSSASTGLDQTNYLTTTPSHAFELALFLEADRMAAPALTEEAFRGESDVVKQETRQRFMNQPSTIPVGQWWLDIREAAFDSFANAHNGAGSFEDIEASTVDDARAFFQRYYTPANAVVAISGDVDSAKARDLVDKHFGCIPARATAPLPTVEEPAPSSERRREARDPKITTPFLAIAWRAPDPADARAHAAAAVLLELLAAGEASRLKRRLVDGGMATMVSGFIEFFGLLFLTRAPTLMYVNVHYPSGGPEPVLAAIDDEISRVANTNAGEVRDAATALVARHLSNIDDVGSLALYGASYELVQSGAEMLDTLVDTYRAVTPADVAAAASTLTPSSRTVLDIQPAEVVPA